MCRANIKRITAIRSAAIRNEQKDRKRKPYIAASGWPFWLLILTVKIINQISGYQIVLVMVIAKGDNSATHITSFCLS